MATKSFNDYLARRAGERSDEEAAVFQAASELFAAVGRNRRVSLWKRAGWRRASARPGRSK
jgi:hypothetical protein